MYNEFHTCIKRIIKREPNNPHKLNAIIYFRLKTFHLYIRVRFLHFERVLHYIISCNCVKSPLQRLAPRNINISQLSLTCN